jgi:nicotinic acid phosphoribosyltransferase
MTMAAAGQGRVSALFTDLYEVTMAQAYLAEGMSGSRGSMGSCEVVLKRPFQAV